MVARRRISFGLVLVAALGLAWCSGPAAGGEAGKDGEARGTEARKPAGEARKDARFFVPGVYEPRGEKLAWRKGFWTEAKPGWAWVPAGWIRLSRGWGYQPGYWRPVRLASTVPDDRPPPRAGAPRRRVTIVMPGPGIPDVRDGSPTVLYGDPDALAGRVVGPILPPAVVNSKERMAARIEGEVDWDEIAARRARMTSATAALMGYGSVLPSGVGGAGPRPAGAAAWSIASPSQSFYIGSSAPGTTYQSYAGTTIGGPGQATYIGSSLPGTAYPSYSGTPAGGGQSFYIGNTAPGASYPSYGAGPGMSTNGYGYGTAPPGNTAGQASGG